MWQLWVDTGGTFTDCFGISPEGKWYRRKVLSSGVLRGQIEEVVSSSKIRINESWGSEKDIFRGYTFILLETGQEVIISEYDPASGIMVLETSLECTAGDNFEITAREEAPVLAGRLITGTPLSDPLPQVEIKLGTTRGTNALLERKGAKTLLIVNEGFKDLLTIGTQQRNELFALEVVKNLPLYDNVVELPGRVSAEGKVVSELTKKQVQEKLSGIADDYEAVAVAFINSHVNNVHEKLVLEVLEEFQTEYISTSSDLSGLMKYLYRAETALINSYLSPVLHQYLGNISASSPEGRIKVMSSSGGLVKVSSFQPKDSLFSGPAGGVAGAVEKAALSGVDKVITFDMGGTSTDVARYSGQYEYVYEQEIGDAHLFSPALSIETVAAGGGSVCSFDGYRLTVGPESAGASPGPACYGAGGPLSVTDINLLLGRLDPSRMGIPLSSESAESALEELIAKMPDKPDKEQVLMDLLDIANEKMASTVKKITTLRGINTEDHALVGFGGAGGMHACKVAELLNIKKVIIPADAGILSAYGIGTSGEEKIAEEQVLSTWEDIKEEYPQMVQKLKHRALGKLLDEGFPEEETEVVRVMAYLRLKGQEASLEINTEDPEQVEPLFKSEYEKVYGSSVTTGALELESLRIVASEKKKRYQPAEDRSPGAAEPLKQVQCYTGREWKKVPVYFFMDLPAGFTEKGPAVVLDNSGTTYVEEGWTIELDDSGNLVLHAVSVSEFTSSTTEAGKLELFSNRFKAVAENMGAVLQRTSLSVNVKERLDFSCALLDTSGRLIANAPHVPVHLGSIGYCVRKVKDLIEMGPGDVVVTNHPGAGGSHLPDVTVISPVYQNNSLIGYVANRAHHAEIGGSTPGSMPPDAKTLEEEGVIIPPVYLVKKGEPQWEEMEKIFLAGKYPSRQVGENLADLNAALAANHRGARDLIALVESFGADEVAEYMNKVLWNSRSKVALILKDKIKEPAFAEEFLDDGSRLFIKITPLDGRWKIDFTGTSDSHKGNLNATPAIVNSVVVYVLRCLLSEDVPLNDGLLEVIDLVLPEGTMLSPSDKNYPEGYPAVAGGNTEVSQRLTDTLFKVFEVVACSQGTMNNVLFGNERFGYYETLGGGTGAGEGFNGASGVHHHMTNTRITDPEVLEYRYPVRLEEMSLRTESGGKGQWSGGEGVIRKYRFLEDVTLTALTQHRTEAPYGLQGGDCGGTGKQWVERSNGKNKPVAGIEQVELRAGDAFIIQTPGGGGWGRK